MGPQEHPGISLLLADHSEIQLEAIAANGNSAEMARRQEDSVHRPDPPEKGHLAQESRGSGGWKVAETPPRGERSAPRVDGAEETGLRMRGLGIGIWDAGGGQTAPASGPEQRGAAQN